MREKKKNGEGKGGKHLETVNIFFEEEKTTEKEEEENIMVKEKWLRAGSWTNDIILGWYDEKTLPRLYGRTNKERYRYSGNGSRKQLLFFWILSKLPPPPAPPNLDNFYNFF